MDLEIGSPSLYWYLCFVKEPQWRGAGKKSSGLFAINCYEGGDREDDNAPLLQKYKMISLLNSDDLYQGIILWTLTLLVFHNLVSCFNYCIYMNCRYLIQFKSWDLSQNTSHSDGFKATLIWNFPIWCKVLLCKVKRERICWENVITGFWTKEKSAPPTGSLSQVIKVIIRS